MGKFLFSIVFLFGSLSFAQSQDTEKTERYWQGTRLRMPYVSLMVNDYLCRENREKFYSCIQALNALAVFLKDPEQSKNETMYRKFILPSELKKEHTVISKLDGLILVEAPVLKFEGMSLREVTNKINEIRAAHILAVNLAYEEKSQIKFNDLIKSFSVLLGGKPNEAYAASQAINAFYASSLDPHSRILSIEENKAEQASAGFTGIGVALENQKGEVKIEDVFPNSPALKSGILIGDVIAGVDGTRGLDINGVVKKIRGEENTSVTIHILRDGVERNIEVIRQNIPQPKVESKNLNSIGYVKLRHFEYNKACNDVYEAILELQKQNINGLILDLRGNPGGYIDHAVCIGAIFLGTKATVVIQKDLDDGATLNYNYKETREAQQRQRASNAINVDLPENGIGQNYPVAVLVDAKSASASEIVAGALQDANAFRMSKRYWVLGDTTFGKGTVQLGDNYQLNGMPIRGVGFRKTIARFHQPSGRTNQIVGIHADFNIDPKPNATEDEKFARREVDLFQNALPSLGDSWKQPYPQYVSKIEGCVTQKGKALKQYEIEKLSKTKMPDYRLLVSQDIMGCLLENPM